MKAQGQFVLYYMTATDENYITHSKGAKMLANMPHYAFLLCKDTVFAVPTNHTAVYVGKATY